MRWHPDHEHGERIPRCEACGLPMVVTKGRRHAVCDPTTSSGKACICRPGCSRRSIGDGDVDCDADCIPCRLGRGSRLDRPKR